MTKKDTTKVLDHLRDVGPLTSLEALRRGFGSRLAARVHELRQAGHQITVDKVDVMRADGTEVRVARYTLVKAEGGAAPAPGPAPKVQAARRDWRWEPTPLDKAEWAVITFVFLAIALGIVLGVLRERLS